MFTLILAGSMVSAVISGDFALGTLLGFAAAIALCCESRGR